MNPTDQPTLPPPVNRAVAWFRVTLWLLPTGFAGLSSVGTSWLVNHGMSSPAGHGVWFLSNCIFVIGAGWYQALLAPRALSRPKRISDRVITFFIIQIFLVPLIGALLIFTLFFIFPYC